MENWLIVAVGFEHKLPLLIKAATHTGLQLPIVANNDIESVEFFGESRAAINCGASTDASLQSECAIFYISGNKGKPKSCLLTNEHFLSSGTCLVAVLGIVMRVGIVS